MRISITGHNFDVDSGLKEHTERQVGFALSRFSNGVREVRVRLTDVNADRGGIDKQCRIVVQLFPTGTTVVEDLDANSYAAVSRAAERAGRAVARELRRKWELRRQGPWQLNEIRARKKSKKWELAPWY